MARRSVTCGFYGIKVGEAIPKVVYAWWGTERSVMDRASQKNARSSTLMEFAERISQAGCGMSVCSFFVDDPHRA